MADRLEEALRTQRDAAEEAARERAAVRQAEAQSSRTAFLVLLAVALLSLVVVAAVYLNRPSPKLSGVAAPTPVPAAGGGQ